MKIAQEDNRSHPFEPMNVVGVETPFGFKSIELVYGNITQLPSKSDVLIVSAFREDYSTSATSVIGALNRDLGLSVHDLAQSPALDFRDSLGTWVSTPLSDDYPFGRIVCAELTGWYPPPVVLENVFATLSLLEAKHVPMRTVATPLLGVGDMRIDAPTMIGDVVSQAKLFALRSASLESLMFVEVDADRAVHLSNALDKALGRHHMLVAKTELVKSALARIEDYLGKLDSLFLYSEQVRKLWLGVTARELLTPALVGVGARQIGEVFTNQILGNSKAPLGSKAKSLQEKGVPTWVVGYLDVVRHIGNDAAHSGNADIKSKPPHTEASDMVLCLLCVERLLEYWECHGGEVSVCG